MPKTVMWILLILFSVVFLFGLNCTDNPNNEDLSALFLYEIVPLLENKCLAYPGREKDEIEGDLDPDNAFRNVTSSGLVDGQRRGQGRTGR